MNRVTASKLPEGYVAWVDFNKSPIWMQIMALLPGIDRFAYPLAIRRGLAVMWPVDKETQINKELLSEGWIVKDEPMSEYERYLMGSLAYLKTPSRKTLHNYWLPKVFAPLPLSAWGRQERRRRGVHISNGTFRDYKDKTRVR